MSRKLLSSLTATLLITTLGAPPIGNAKQLDAVDQSSETKVEPDAELANELANSPAAPLPSSHQPAAQANEGMKLGEHAAESPQSITQANRNTQSDTPQSKEAASKANAASDSHTPSTQSSLPSPLASQSSDVIKLGEQQTQSASASDEEIIAKVHSHILNGRQAATLYVRNIPVLTFIGSTRTDSEAIKIGSRNVEGSGTDVTIAGAKSLSDPQWSNESPASSQGDAQNSTATASSAADDSTASDPMLRATQLAAKLNQLNRDGVDGSKITVSWDASNKSALAKEQYDIKVGQSVLAKVDASTILPDTTRSLEGDALQATNRLRRLLGNAAPLSGVSGKPDRGQVISLGPIRLQVQGWASWYGPGFHGNPSASGEIFNQNALTAAHRTLPFGTRVVVTNLDNGQSVMVRIIDRGPFHGNRIIDLSAAAARTIGLIQTGVAPVRLDIVGDRQAAAPGN